MNNSIVVNNNNNINNNNFNNNASIDERQLVVRPTEGQLRWAQFHRKSRARGVQEMVERLWNTPEQVTDVAGALPEDGNTTESSIPSCKDNDQKKIYKRTKPKVSRGRRALLRVSKRIYERRKESIEQNGFRQVQLTSGADAAATAAAESDSDVDDAIEKIFASDSVWRTNKKRTRRRRNRAGNDERLRNFEAACHAMMMNLAAQKPQQPEIIVPTKRWTRSAQVEAAAISLEDYQDLKWGIRRKPPTPTMSEQVTSSSSMPFDRGASWMMHLPGKRPREQGLSFFYSSSHPAGITSNDDLGTPEQSLVLTSRGHAFRELVDLVQGRLAQECKPQLQSQRNPPKMRLSSYFGAPNTQMSTQDVVIGNNDNHVAKDDYGEEKKVGDNVMVPRRKTHRLAERFLPRSPEAPQTQPEESPERPIGCLRCRRLSRVSDAESDFFDSVRKMNVPDLNIPKERLCQSCVKYQEAMDDMESPTKAGDNDESLKNPGGVVATMRENFAAMRRKKEPDDAVDTKSDISVGSLTDLWRKGKSLGNALSSTLNAIPESTNKPSSNDRNVPSPANLSARAASVSGRVSGFFKMMSTPKNDDNDGDFSAIAAFRKSQDQKRESMGDDAASSESSYRPLPNGFRRFVQNRSPSGNSADNINQQGEYDGFDGYGGEPDNGAMYYSPSKSVAGRSSIVDELSPDKFKQFHERLVQNSHLIGQTRTEGTIIDTDETTSRTSGDAVDPKILASILLSPTLITKRHQQAIRAVECRQWEQVSYLLSANPWLAEMTEVTTNQYLLHRLSFYGAGVVLADDVEGAPEQPAAPKELNETMVQMFPPSVHKFDKDGNVPLHMAAASGNMNMIQLLGEKFQSGASVRNEDGMLPLHLALSSFATTCAGGDYLEVVKAILKLFPGGVAIPDNEGNLPIHIAASDLEGPVGVDVIYMLLDEADRQVQNPYGARFYNKVKIEENDNASVSTVSTGRETDSTNDIEDIVHSTMVRNDLGETPLITAIHTHAGWEIIEAIASGPGGRKAASFVDANIENALHLLVGPEFTDPAAALSILKVAPETAAMRNCHGILPVEVACMQNLAPEVILAIVLVDLPIDLDDAEGVKVRDGFGGSWWYLACECDDHYIEIVEEVLSICSFQQVRELCFMKGGSNKNGGTVMARATPYSHQAMTRALRFVGRFEFLGSSALYSDAAKGLKEFDALDFGPGQGGLEDGKRVLLKCYSKREPYLSDTTALRGVNLDTAFVEEVLTFSVKDNDGQSEDGHQYCVSIERPGLTLNKVVAGMLKNEGYWNDQNLRKRYAVKVCSVLRMVARSLRHLHLMGVVHGNLNMETCGKYGETWKVLGRLEMHRIGEEVDISKWEYSFPPEAVTVLPDDGNQGVYDSDEPPVKFDERLIVQPSIDVWAFGKLAFEVLTGEPLVEFDDAKPVHEDNFGLLEIMEWDESALKSIFERLLESGISDNGVDLIASCLLPNPQDRPASMDVILSDPFWKEMRHSSLRKHRKSAGADVSDSPQSI